MTTPLKQYTKKDFETLSPQRLGFEEIDIPIDQSRYFFRGMSKKQMEANLPQGRFAYVKEGGAYYAVVHFLNGKTWQVGTDHLGLEKDYSITFKGADKQYSMSSVAELNYFFSQSVGLSGLKTLTPRVPPLNLTALEKPRPVLMPKVKLKSRRVWPWIALAGLATVGYLYRWEIARTLRSSS